MSEETQAAIKAALPGLLATGFKQFCIVADPDGNLFEVQQFISDAL
jgi:lactoylglutathione lyase